MDILNHNYCSHWQHIILCPARAQLMVGGCKLIGQEMSSTAIKRMWVSSLSVPFTWLHMRLLVMCL